MGKSKKWPSGKDIPPPTSTPVKYYPGLGWAPVRAKKKTKNKLKIA